MQLAFAHCDVLVSISWNLRAAYIAMHSDGELRSVGEFFRADFHVTSVDENKADIERALVVWICVWSEDQGTLNENEAQLRNAIDIN